MARFYRRGISKIYWKAGTDVAPPAASVTLGVGAIDLSDSVAEISGFALTASVISVPDLGTRFTKTIPGEDTTAESSLTMYDDDAGTSAVRTALVKGAIGYITLLPYGKVTGKRSEVWVVQSTGCNDQWTVGTDPARYVVTFAVLETPNQTDMSQT